MAGDNTHVLIAIDGPSGAGKGTVARAIAGALAFRHVDTGAMYRAVAWLARERGADLSDGAAVAELARTASFELSVRTIVDGHDVTTAIRTPEMDASAAAVARHPAVRQMLVERQRQMGRDGRVVMEGRDIGTVVFPGAALKIYLDASPEERARRRALDPAHAAGQNGAAPEAVGRIAEALAARDQSDRTRTASPLTRADDAVYIDTTEMPIDVVVSQVLDLVKTRLT
jgi:cytidylate kinase